MSSVSFQKCEKAMLFVNLDKKNHYVNFPIIRQSLEARDFRFCVRNLELALNCVGDKLSANFSA